MKKIPLEQRQMLEHLTGLQHNIDGSVRKRQNRSRQESIRMGLQVKEPEMSPILRQIANKLNSATSSTPYVPKLKTLLERLKAKQ